jgi:hypothetical protein
VSGFADANGGGGGFTAAATLGAATAADAKLNIPATKALQVPATIHSFRTPATLSATAVNKPDESHSNHCDNFANAPK